MSPAREASSRKARAAALAVLIVALSGLAGCGSKGLVGDRISGKKLTIYSSMPLDGDSSMGGQAVVNGERMALDSIHGRIGKYHIVFVPLDDATPQRGSWDPGQTTVNARLAVQDPTAIGYIGEFNSGASAISIPLLNRTEIPQVSPASTAVGLTSGGPAASPGEPEKYYPNGVRTFARIVPNDSVQAAAQVHLQQSMGCKRVLVLDDGEVDGEDTATSFALAAQSAGLPVVAVQAFVPGAADYSSLVAGIAQDAVDCVLISAISEPSAALLTRQLAAAIPSIRIFASSSEADVSYTDPGNGGIPASVDPRVLITVPTLAPSAYPPSGQAFLAAYARRYGAPEPYAIYGYEAMSLLLNAIDRATDHGTKAAVRSSVLREIFKTRNRESALGTYSIDRDGDTTLRRYGVYRVVAGRLSFVEALSG